MPGGQRDGGPRRDQVGAQAIDLEGPANRADLLQHAVGQPHGRQPLARGDHAPGNPFQICRPVRGESGWVRLIRKPPPDHFGALRRVLARGHLDGQPEPVKQLRPELAFLRIHGAHQQEPGGVPDRQAFPLDVVHAQGRRVKQQVDKVIMQQVHLVDVEQAAVRRGEQPGLECGDPLGQRPLDVQRPGQPVLGGADRQLGQPGGPPQPGRLVRVRAVRAARVGSGGVAGEPAAGHDVRGRQQRGQAADHGRLRGALLAPDQHAADGRRHGVEQQCELEVSHPDDRGERVVRPARWLGPSWLGWGWHHRASSFPGVRARSWCSRRPESPGSRISARPAFPPRAASPAARPDPRR